MNIQERIEALETEFAERLKALKAEVQQVDEFPQDWDEYWYMDINGDAVSEKWLGVDIEKDMFEIGNFFKTKDQVEFAAEKLKVEAELRKFSRPFEIYSLNFIMCFDTKENKLYSETRRFMTQGAFYFEHIGKIDLAIKSVGEERIKKYIFGVED